MNHLCHLSATSDRPSFLPPVLMRAVARVLIVTLLAHPSFGLAQVVTAPGGASPGQANNGVPIVNINAPNSTGLSHNRFQDYNVGREGLILNNATAKLQNTQLGGIIQGNPNLKGNAARLILNEVTGGKRSNLLGYTEIAGSSAHLIVANPNGITCDGCGFLNAPRVTLGTGTPIFAGDRLSGYNVTGGDILIEGLGLNAANIDRFDLIARSVQLNAALYAQKLDIVAGVNQVDATTLAATAQNSDDPVPTFAIDSTALGGMYANAIRLVSTEHGVGVTLAGDMAASGGDLTLDTAGKLTLTNASASGDLRLDAVEIASAGTVTSGGDLTVQSEALKNEGTLFSTGNQTLAVTKFDNTGTVVATGELTTQGETLTNDGGLIASGGDMHLFTTTLINRNADIYSLGGLALLGDATGTAMDRMENRSGSIESAGDLWINAGTVDNRKDSFSLAKTQTQGHIDVICNDCSGDHYNVDYVLHEHFTTEITADSAASSIHSGGDLAITSGTLTNDASTISAAGDMVIAVDRIDNIGAALADTNRDARFNTGRITDGTHERFYDSVIHPYNNAPFPKPTPDLARWNQVSDIITLTPGGALAPAIIQAGGELTIAAGEFNNLARLSGDELFAAEVAAGATLVERAAQVTPGTSYSLPSPSGLFQVSAPGHHYLIETNPAFASLKSFINSDYLLTSLGYDPDQMQKRLGDGLYEQRLIEQALAQQTGQRFLEGWTGGDEQFRVLMENAAAQHEGLNLRIGVSLTPVQIAALTSDIVWLEEREVMGEKVLVPVLYLADAGHGTAAATVQGRNVTLSVSGKLTNSGTLAATQDLAAAATDIDNRGGQIKAGDSLALIAEGNITNRQGGVIQGGDTVSLVAQGDITNERTITYDTRSGKGFSQRTAVVDDAARIESGGNLNLVAGGDIKNAGGTLKSGGDMALTAGGDISLVSAEVNEESTRQDKRHLWQNSSTTQYGSEIEAGGNLGASAQNIEVVASKVKAGENLTLDAAEDVRIASAANAQSSEYHYKRHGKKVDNENASVRQQGATLEAGGDVAIVSGHDVEIQASTVAAQGDASVIAGNDVKLTAAQDSDYAYAYTKKKGHFGSAKMKMSESEADTAVVSTISAGENLTLAAGNDIATQGTQITAGDTVQVMAGGDIVLDAADNFTSQAQAKSKKGLTGGKAKGSGIARTTATGTNIAAETVDVLAGSNAALQGAEINAQTSTLQAGDNLWVGTADEKTESYSYKKKSGFNFSFQLTAPGQFNWTMQKKRTTHEVIDPKGSALAADTLGLEAGSNLIVQGSQLTGTDALTLTAGNALALLTAQRQETTTTKEDRYQIGAYSGNTFMHWHGESKTESETQSVKIENQGSTLTSNGDIVLKSGSDQLLQMATLKSGGDVVLESDGDIVFQAAKDVDQKTTTGKGEYSYVWQSTKNHGHIDETVRQSHIQAQGELILKAAGKIQVEITDGDEAALARMQRMLAQVENSGIDANQITERTVSQTIDAMVAADPELAWLKDLEARGDIDWQKVKEVHKEWDKDQSGLTAVGGIVAAIVITILTWGAASAAVGTLASATAGSGTAMATGTAAAAAGWANTAVTGALVGMGSNAAVQLGTTGKVDWDQTLKSGLVSLVTAGLLQSAGNALGAEFLGEGKNLFYSENPFSLGGVAQAAGRGVVRAGVASAIQGADFEDGLVNSIVGDYAQTGAQWIGDTWGGGKNPALQTVAHAALGATAAGLTGKDAVAGAIGGAVESIIGNVLPDSVSAGIDNKKWGALIYTVGTALVAGAISDATGHDGAIAASAAQNAAQNNRQLHPDEIAFLRDKDRVNHYIAYMKEQGVTLSFDEARQDLEKYGTAMLDKGWTYVNGRDDRTETFIRQEVAQNQSTVYLDSHGVAHSMFEATAAEYNDLTINLRALFRAYGDEDKTGVIHQYLSDIQAPAIPLSEFHQLRLAAYQAGAQDADKLYNETPFLEYLSKRVVDVGTSLVMSPYLIGRSIYSDEYGLYDSSQMEANVHALLQLQGRVAEEGYLAGFGWEKQQQLVSEGIVLPVAGSAIWKLLGAAAKEGVGAFSTTEINALRGAGLSDAEIAQHVALNGDVYLFRGTSPGWAGSSGAQATAVSASTDPYIATIFALEARAQGGQGTLLFGSRSQIGTFDVGNWMALQEREVGVLLSPFNFATRAPYNIPADVARGILRDMGLPELPYSVENPSTRSTLIDAAPRMTPAQINEFLRRAGH